MSIRSPLLNQPRCRSDPAKPHCRRWILLPCAAVPEGYAWLVSDSDPAVAAAAEQSAPGAPAFLLTPTGAGDCFFELDLAGTADREDVLCRLVMTVESAAGKTLSASVTGSRLELRDGVLRGGGDFGAPYRIRTDPPERYGKGR